MPSPTPGGERLSYHTEDGQPRQHGGTVFPAYRKALHGPIAAGRIGLERIRTECPHFGDWLQRMETLAGK